MVKSIKSDNKMNMSKNIVELLNMFIEYTVDQIGVDFESPLEDNEMEASELINNFVKKHQDKIKAMTPKASDDKDGKKKKKAKDPNAPKKAKTAYMFFCDAKRAEVKEDNPEMKAKEILTELGKLWGEMEEEDKQEYVDQANEDKERYQTEYSEYEPSEGFTKKGEKKTPKRAPSGYILFCNDHRKEVKEENPEMNQKEITTELGRLWKEAPAKVQEKYNKKSKEMGAKLKKEKAENGEEVEEKPKKTGKSKKEDKKSKEEDEEEEVEEKPKKADKKKSESKKGKKDDKKAPSKKGKKVKDEEDEEEEVEEKPKKGKKEDKKKKQEEEEEEEELEEEIEEEEELEEEDE